MSPYKDPHMNRDSRPWMVQLPALSDQAAVAIVNFLQECVLRFEIEYSSQIRRYYEAPSSANLIPPPPTDNDDPPF